MKQFGLFKRIALTIAAFSTGFRNFFKTPGRGSGGQAYKGQGRDAFLAISTPKCHTQKGRYHR